jgi:mannose-6-phosphate isomerase-like protein (cupin superfamily)
MENSVVNLQEKLTKISEHWSPGIIARLNDYHLKLAKVKGEFVWHSHPETDELFLVLEGQLNIELEDGPVTLREGELYVVPRGVVHRPVADEECHILLIEPAGTVNTGDTEGDFTLVEEQWL